MTYADRVHQCDTCDKGGHAQLGELLPDGWARDYTKGTTVCDDCQRKLEDNRRYGVERSRERALGEGT